ncbi:unnamed protein product [Meloidogyne enterolobii]|uniref:Uncharacterized protein n=1 Tax=Meloidogyne enterolobii TaxID=390850 RepID=A0ACB0YB46_MELEN
MGWLKTVDDYYTGANPSIFNVGVQYILSTVVAALNKNPSRRFSYAETGFLTMWLEDKYSEEIENMRKLIVEKGGWTQPDEACTHYYELIDQYRNCGVPKVAWQIDPFGHSSEHGNMLINIGYEALFFSRMHYLELENRIKNKSLEMLWQTDENGDATRPLFTSTFFKVPQGFCFDPTCPYPDFIIDNPELEGYNIDQKLNDFLNIVNEQVKVQRHNHVLISMGGNFTYSNAELWFNNLDKLILAGNKKVNI